MKAPRKQRRARTPGLSSAILEVLNDIDALAHRFVPQPRVLDGDAAERFDPEYVDFVDRALAKRWLAGHQAAERRVLEVMAEDGAQAPDESFSRAMELLELAPADDPFRGADAAQARAAWVKLVAWAASRDRR
jgi:hypothetical protein